VTDAAAPTPALAAGDRTRILVYCGVIIVVLNTISPSAGFQVVPFAFILKNKLHLGASELALFGAWAGIPGYLSFAFGMARDFWNPFKLGDRGYLMLFGGASALTFAVFAFLPVSLPMLLAASALTSICFLFTWSAWNGLGSVIGQQFAMSGQISALWNFLATVTIFAALFLGGVLSEHLETLSAAGAVRILFLIGAAIMAVIALTGAWRPDAVYSHLDKSREQKRDLFADIKRLAAHRAIYPALGIWLLWNFSPGGTTVLQYHMANTLHATDTQYGAYAAVFSIAFVPTLLLFGFLSPRYPLSRLLWWGLALAVPQMVPVLFAQSANQVVLAAIPMGLLGGMANGATLDLVIRSCPRGLEGTLMMLAWSLYAIATNIGNLFGTAIYDRYGFAACIAVTTAVYALMLPLLALVPKSLIATADGQAAPS
jgi:hypothetical protein